MKLMLSVISSNENLARPSRIILNQESASIGRHEDNTVVLVDPQRYISSHHALIEYIDSNYFITDTSANGIIVNQSVKPLGRGNKIKLKDGDQLKIADYKLTVQFIEEDALPDLLPTPAISSQTVNILDDPFAEFNTDPIQNVINSNELNFPATKGNAYLPDDPFADFPVIPDFKDDTFDKQEESHPEMTAFDHIPSHKEAFQPSKGQNVKQPPESPAPPLTEDIFPPDWIEDIENIKVDVLRNSPGNIPPVTELNLQTPLITPKPSLPVQEAGINNELIQAFLEGAQLDPSKFVDKITPQTFHIIGSMLRSSIQGARDVLEGRSLIKNEMHLDVTLIRPRENNPIKFSVSTDEALAKLLLPADKAYLTPEKAVNEAFNDISTHQYSVIAGMKSAFHAILKRFDPKILEERLQKQSPLGASIPIHRQAKLWRLFEDLYETLEKETQDNFYELFGRAFSETYSQMIAKLKHNKTD